MRVPARIYGSERIILTMDEAVKDQITNVCLLPGILRYAICMPDGHSGYGFPIGGVAAIDPSDGVISPGGIGFDINCGIRLLSTNLHYEDVKNVIPVLVDRLFAQVPAGVGKEGMLSLSKREFDDAMIKGVKWALERGYAEQEDLERIEDGGCISGADPKCISSRAYERGNTQVGTLGSGNHFLEIQIAKRENIFDEKIAREFGIVGDDQIMIMIHCGSRGFGHQVATDYLQKFLSVMPKYGLKMPDKELACAPFDSKEGQDYFKAMNCAINIAFLNRQLIAHRVREVFSDVFRRSPRELGIQTVYDVCHNTAKLENHEIDGKMRKLLVHRKGATRAFPAGRKELPECYRHVGQPVIIGGSMESSSLLLVGCEGAKEAFYTTAHGSGRVLSRSQAKKQFRGDKLQQELRGKGIYVRTASLAGLAEEAGAAYKDIDEVGRSTEGAGLSKVIAKLVPLGNIKG
ncbi:MAG: RtcB family protein [Spirochaetes bacterium]|nr:RtcB family protein [Spirochaetota bacterium]